MASFDFTNYVTSEYNSIEDALDEIATYMATVVDTTTIRTPPTILSVGGGQLCVGYVVHDT